MGQDLKDKTVLVIDDDPSLGQMVQLAFTVEGAKAVTAGDGQDGLRQFYAHRPDLVILDIRMPDIDGWEVLRQIRVMADTPVILLTTLSEDQDIVRGLDYGADDFISKPFNRGVLLARARAVLRRAQLDKEQTTSETFQDDWLVINLSERQVVVGGESVRLTATEFRLLSYLIQNAGRVLTYNQILDQVWGQDYRDSPDYVHVYLSHLRRKIEEDSRNPRYLLTEHGVGYRFARD
jgi:two-component system KDP operon response regulator KdpE